ncbi:hypothetical protein I79_009177 [Cricetulus griseus]|uniref:Uncharacterized protein n=1 Tax=Cricetulus griseus TaxID=10029 RepID=G3HF24_CRIGR|nr:hypothetical protein I79_009177 [Cricetulus griseus]
MSSSDTTCGFGLDLSVLFQVTIGGFVTVLVLSSQNKRERHVYITPPSVLGLTKTSRHLCFSVS